MEGWRPVEELVRWGFAHAPVALTPAEPDQAGRP